GAVVIVSHDRYFLNRMCREIAELEHGALTLYPYPYNRYHEEKEQRIVSLEDAAARQQREIARQTRFIERFRAKNTKATLVQSRIKALEKVEIIQTHQQTASIGFSFQCAGRGAKEMIQLRGVTKRYGGRAVFENLDYTLWRGDRVALIGPNGAGKSTLLKLLGGQIMPEAGEVQPGEGVIVRSFAQRQVDVLDPAKTVYEETLADIAPAQAARARDILGSFLFTGDDVGKRIALLSGGEKSRVALAKMALAPSHVLLLDEPTNPLDLKSRMALEQALAAFEGALVVVSHDRAVMDAMANKVVKVDRGRLIEYPGNWTDYEQSRLAESLRAASAPDVAVPREPDVRKEARRESAQKRQELARITGPLKRRLEEAEADITARESAVASLERELADPSVYRDPRRSADASRALAQSKAALAALMAEWEAMAAELERLNSVFNG
ncbi:MAG: ABC-F family ATP-binding cassette domain-containing protein, partial [Nitrospinae bacterium]|nr:ABC-F family ATP-binding cassette domain-containing protein [Nitrospinota bacterium]